jgi:hypothetical protein
MSSMAGSTMEFPNVTPPLWAKTALGRFNIAAAAKRNATRCKPQLRIGFIIIFSFAQKSAAGLCAGETVVAETYAAPGLHSENALRVGSARRGRSFWSVTDQVAKVLPGTVCVSRL